MSGKEFADVESEFKPPYLKWWQAATTDPVTEAAKVSSLAARRAQGYPGGLVEQLALH
ncbi:MAG: hypothetical protein AAF644_16025 [Pseudomonadota bacterium]